jgi:hypothetical protein
MWNILKKHSEKEQAESPDTPTYILFDLATRYPEQVLRNPVLALLALENPEHWFKIDVTAKTILTYNKLKEKLEKSKESDKKKYYLLSAKKYLPLFEEWFPGDRRPHDAIEMADRVLREPPEDLSLLQTLKIKTKARTLALSHISNKLNNAFQSALIDAQNNNVSQINVHLNQQYRWSDTERTIFEIPIWAALAVFSVSRIRIALIKRRFDKIKLKPSFPWTSRILLERLEWQLQCIEEITASSSVSV